MANAAELVAARGMGNGQLRVLADLKTDLECALE